MTKTDHNRARSFSAEHGKNWTNMQYRGREVANLSRCYLELYDELERAKSRYTLAEVHLQKVCDKAESEDKCLLCREDFSDDAVREFPDCPVPAARDYLADPERLAGAVTKSVSKREGR